jgi:hypothetical protein
MKTSHFDKLSMHNKTLLIDDMATELGSIVFYDHRIYLYSLNSLFIEACHNLDTGKIERINVVRYADLDKFLVRIRLQPLRQPTKSR